jgi:hypothetical protein
VSLDCALIQSSADHWDFVSPAQGRVALPGLSEGDSASHAATTQAALATLSRTGGSGKTVGLFAQPEHVLALEFDTQLNHAISNVVPLDEQLQRDIPWPIDQCVVAYEMSDEGKVFGVCMQRDRLDRVMSVATDSGLLPTVVLSAPILIAATGLHWHLRNSQGECAASGPLRIVWLESAGELDVVWFDARGARRWWHLPTRDAKAIQQLITRLSFELMTGNQRVQLLISDAAEPPQSLSSIITKLGIDVCQVRFPTIDQCLPEAPDVMRLFGLPNLCQQRQRGRSVRLSRLHQARAALLAGLATLALFSAALFGYAVVLDQQGDSLTRSLVAESQAAIPGVNLSRDDDLEQIGAAIARRVRRWQGVESSASALSSLHTFLAALPDDRRAVLTELRIHEDQILATFYVADYQGVPVVLEAVTGAGIEIVNSRTQHNDNDSVTLELEALGTR